MRIHKEGYNIIAVAFIFLSCIALISYFILGWGLPAKILSGFLLTLFVFIICFFRTPRRISVIDKDLVVAPCDGKIVMIEEVEEKEFLKERCLQISVFMSVFNVHVNYYPVGGKVLYSKHHHGDYIVASHPKSSEKNERTAIVVETQGGVKIFFRQIAGYIARRIVCYAKPGDNVSQCSQVGFIKFGSRMDILIPIGSEVNVKLGDKVVACETILAHLK